eukprot:14572906-Heterocapsa_arctica.AAC.1
MVVLALCPDPGPEDAGSVAVWVVRRVSLKGAQLHDVPLEPLRQCEESLAHVVPNAMQFKEERDVLLM